MLKRVSTFAAPFLKRHLKVNEAEFIHSSVGKVAFVRGDRLMGGTEAEYRR